MNTMEGIGGDGNCLNVQGPSRGGHYAADVLRICLRATLCLNHAVGAPRR